MVRKGPFVMIGGTTAVQPDGTVYGAGVKAAGIIGKVIFYSSQKSV